MTYGLSDETEDFFSFPRWLQDETNSTNNSTDSADEDEAEPTDGEVLRLTFTIYGSIFLVVWLLFCWLRLKYPRPFTIRRWTTKENLKVCENRSECCRDREATSYPRNTARTTFSPTCCLFPFADSPRRRAIWILFLDVDAEYDHRR
jgi:hypothetical protein